MQLNATDWLVHILELAGQDWATLNSGSEILASKPKLDIILAARTMVETGVLDSEELEFFCPSFVDQHLRATDYEI